MRVPATYTSIIILGLLLLMTVPVNNNYSITGVIDKKCRIRSSQKSQINAINEHISPIRIASNAEFVSAGFTEGDGSANNPYDFLLIDHKYK